MKEKNMQNGLFIVKDGTDGSGKQTQAELMVSRLRADGHRVETIDFPRYQDNLAGQLLRECLDGKRGDFMATDPRVASMLFAVDRFESSKQIRGWLEEGAVVVADRYVSANMLHQGAKISDSAERDEFLAWLDLLEHSTFEIPRPDIIFYLDMPYEVRRKMMEDRDELDVAEADTQHQIDTEKAATDIVSSLNAWHTITCASDGRPRTREDIHEEIYQIIRGKLPAIT